MIEECPVKGKGKGKGSGATSSRSYFGDWNADLKPGQEHLQGIGFHDHSEKSSETNGTSTRSVSQPMKMSWR